VFVTCRVALNAAVELPELPTDDLAFGNIATNTPIRTVTMAIVVILRIYLY